MRALSERFRPYEWALSTAEIARLAGIAPEQVLRFDGNTPPHPRPTSNVAAVERALARVNTYAHGGFPELLEAIADYAGVGTENIVLGAGADDLIMLVARSFAGPGDVVSELNERQAPAPISSISAALALAGLADPPDVSETLEERDRLAAGLRGLDLEPASSWANFVYVPVAEAGALTDALLRKGLAVRGSA